MVDVRGFAVHQLGRSDDSPTEGVRDALVTETDPKQRNLPGEAPHYVY